MQSLKGIATAPADYASAHLKAAAAPATGVSLVAAPLLVAAPVLGVLGFTANGAAAGMFSALNLGNSVYLGVMQFLRPWHTKRYWQRRWR